MDLSKLIFMGVMIRQGNAAAVLLEGCEQKFCMIKILVI